VSIGKRIIDLAKANLNALLDKAGDETPLEQLTDEELEAELARRKERKRQQDEERKAAERAAQSARARANQQSPPPRTNVPPPRTTVPPPRTSAPPPRPGAPKTSAPPPRTSTPPPRQEQKKAPFIPSRAEKRLRELYAQLETPYGAPFEEVKKSFRRLMRKYHPDLHIANPNKHKTATQLTMSLTQAYNELEVHLTRGR
jgi:hypothetical protein